MMMHIKVPFLAVLIISVFQIALYGIHHNAHGKKDFTDILAVQQDNITEIEITDLSRKNHHITDPKQIQAVMAYFNQFQYQRLRNDQTAYMPMKTIMIYVHDGEQTDFLIPYGDEILMSHKAYQIKNGTFDVNAFQTLLSTK